MPESSKTSFVCRAQPGLGLGQRPSIEKVTGGLRRDLARIVGEPIAARVEPAPKIARGEGRVAELLSGNLDTMSLTLRIRVIYAVEDDGKEPDGHAPPDKATLAPMFSTLVEAMRQDWAGTGLDFIFFPERDLEIRADTKLNHDFDFPSNVISKFPCGTSVYTEADIRNLFTQYSNDAHRNTVAAERPNTLLWIVSEPNWIAFDQTINKWVYSPHVPGSHSGGDVDFVVLNKWDFAQSVVHNRHDASRAAHETGHYLHLWHTHTEHAPFTELPPAPPGAPTPDTPARQLDRWKKAIADWIDTKVAASTAPADALALCDNDRGAGGVADTPADPGVGLLALVNLADHSVDNPLGALGSVTVKPQNTTQPVTFTPDRNNPMSYYLDGAGNDPMRFSADQIAVMRGALINGNRRRLVAAQLGDTVHPHTRTCGVWSPSTKPQFFAWAKSRERHDENLAHWKQKGYHLVEQCAYAVGGVVYYDAFWDEGAIDQVVILARSEAEVKAAVTTQESAGRRVRRIQAYLQPGAGLRYNVIFEPGTGAQHVLLGATQVQVDQAWKDLMPKDNRFRHLDVTKDEAGVLRYSAVLAPGTQVQHYVTNWKLEDIDDDYATQWNQGRKLSNLSVVMTPAGMSYSGVWDPDPRGQLVLWLHVRERISEVYDEMWWQGFRLRSLHTIPI
ncbi:MAG: hypothetical protein QM820_64090 [Minicystis sp.]